MLDNTKPGQDKPSNPVGPGDRPGQDRPTPQPDRPGPNKPSDR